MDRSNINMSLYTFNEICRNCKNAVWHECCKSFCHCKIGEISEVNHYDGTCKHKEKIRRLDNE